jgi:hypothetical protein
MRRWITLHILQSAEADSDHDIVDHDPDHNFIDASRRVDGRSR